jgi:two-component system response regulator HydG
VTWTIIMVTLSESFRSSLDELLRELNAVSRPWSPGNGPIPDPVAPLLVLAGGAEGAAMDLLGSLGREAGRRVLVAGASPDHRLSAALVRAGAEDYFALPGDLEPLRRSLERSARMAGAREQSARFAADERKATGFASIIGESPSLRRTLEQARRVARHGDVTVLVGGETGTGKELLARAIHYEGPRATGPFVEINCAAIPASLLESELFGHEKGAFTGALAQKPGLFELAHGGTLFLDEVGTLPLELQAKLLRALESRVIRRVGGQRTHEVDVRIIAATHADLRAAIARGEFREDLFYRLNVVALTLPPLRERALDVELLTQVFLQRLAARYGIPVPVVSPAIAGALHAHPWPGNVRELRNAIERALVLSPQGQLDPAALFAEDTAQPAPRSQAAIPFPADLDSITRSAVRAMLDLAGGNKSEAARRLGISRPRLNRLLDEH